MPFVTHRIQSILPSLLPSYHTLPAILLSVLSLPSFVGIITVVSSRIAHKIDLSLAFLFAAGALLTTAVVHIIPEAMEGLAPDFPGDLHGMFLRSGITVLSGIFLGMLLHVVLDDGGHSHSAHALPTPQLRPSATVAERDCEGTRSASNSLDDDDGGGDVHSCREREAATATAAAGAAAAAGKDGVGFGTVVVGVAFSAGGGGNGASGDDDGVEAGQRFSNGHHATTTNGHNGNGSGSVSAALHAPAVGHRVKFGEGRGARVGARAGAGGSSVDATGAMAPPPATASFLSRTMPPGNLYDLTGARKGHRRGVFDVKGLDPVCWNIIVGDLAHNFADGVTMGAAFLGCSSTVGWTVTAANMMHEIPHEIGNFLALVNGGMTVTQVRRYTPFFFFF